MRSRAVYMLFLLVALSSFATVQAVPYERSFPQSKAAIEKTLKKLQPSLAGRLPTLDGFVTPGTRSLESFQRGYYQCSVEVRSNGAGSTVRVNAKITAWYNDADAAKSGYQVLPSNGRLEGDLLDRLGDAIAGDSAQAPSTTASAKSGQPAPSGQPAQKTRAEAQPTIAAPVPRDSQPIITTKKDSASSPFQMSAPGAPDPATQKAVSDRHSEELEKEAKNLEEILRNQAHPNNLAAVKKSGTPVLISPNTGAKPIFMASAEDEFEILDMNATWVHVRVSGLSRGWIMRSNVETPDAYETDNKPIESAPMPATSAEAKKGPAFEIENEEMATFPGDWMPLQGKTVAIVSVRKTNEKATDAGQQEKLEFAKSIFERKYAELTKTATTAAGVVVIFDSADGGMLAATLSVLQTWKTGTLSDDALWRRCYFDPPEMYKPSGQ